MYKSSLIFPLIRIKNVAYSTPVGKYINALLFSSQRTWDMKSRSDEMDMLQFVLRKFKSVYYHQEQLRHFPTYDTLNVSLKTLPYYEHKSEWLISIFVYNALKVQDSTDLMLLTDLARVLLRDLLIDLLRKMLRDLVRDLLTDLVRDMLRDLSTDLV